MNKVEVNKETIVELWNSQCSSASNSSQLERKGTAEGEMISLFINNDVSMMLFKKSLKVIFGGQIEYASEEVSETELASLEHIFEETEERLETKNREEVVRKGVNSLNSLLAK
jgi:hypothetical protein